MTEGWMHASSFTDLVRSTIIELAFQKSVAPAEGFQLLARILHARLARQTWILSQRFWARGPQISLAAIQASSDDFGVDQVLHVVYNILHIHPHQLCAFHDLSILPLQSEMWSLMTLAAASTVKLRPMASTKSPSGSVKSS